MSDETSEFCFCALHKAEELNHFRECLNCQEKLCEVCIGEDKNCECGGILNKGGFKHTYITKGEILFEICETHSSYQSHFYCSECNKYLCVICTRDTIHQNHKTILIDDYIKIQRKNIDNQKENIANVINSLKNKFDDLENKKKELNLIVERKKENTNLISEKFSKLIKQTKDKKKKLLEGYAVSEIIALKNELISRKTELELRKKHIENFKNFIIDENNHKLLAFMSPEDLLKENINFANQMIEKIDYKKKYHYSKITFNKKENAGDFKFKEERSRDKIIIDDYFLPNNLKEIELPTK